MRVLFYKADFAWPRASGHDVHTYHMMRSMAELGVRVSLATVKPPPPEALAGASIERILTLDAHTNGTAGDLGLRSFEERFRSYWGIPSSRIRAFGQFSREIAADAVVVSGLDVLPMLGGINGAVRIWYAGDEWVWHHLSQVRASERESWGNLRDAVVKGLYERAYRHRIDRAWTVSAPDRRALRFVAGVRHVDTIANGVATDHYRPTDAVQEANSAVFWGRLDFGPNIQALQWFVREVWPSIRAVRPTAQFTIVGFHPTPPIEALCRVDGVRLKPDVPDIRPEVARAAVVVLPFVSGGGIKNKLLEAAAMGKAIVATPRALLGLKGDAPIRIARNPSEWAAAITTLWDDAASRTDLGQRARTWVNERHTWNEAARVALSGIEQSMSERART